MKRQQDITSEWKSLRIKIRNAFQAFRRSGKRGLAGYPQHLRAMAIAAVTGGVSAGEVAKAAGVSEPSMRNWLKKHGACPQELTVTPDPAAKVALEPEGAVARIRLVNGVTVEVPLSEVSGRLAAMLSAAAQSSSLYIAGGDA